MLTRLLPLLLLFTLVAPAQAAQAAKKRHHRRVVTMTTGQSTTYLRSAQKKKAPYIRGKVKWTPPKRKARRGSRRRLTSANHVLSDTGLTKTPVRILYTQNGSGFS